MTQRVEMQPFTVHTGVAAPLDEANVDTNQICPTRFNQVPRGDRFSTILFHDRRFDAQGAPFQTFVLNLPPYDHATILVSGRNFGCGSSRETAVYGLVAFGIRAVIAESFGDIFVNNAVRNGLLPIALGTDATRILLDTLKDNIGLRVAVDLPEQTVSLPGGRIFSFAIEPLVKRRLIAGIDEITLTGTYADQIDAFEASYLAEQPSLINDRRSR